MTRHEYSRQVTERQQTIRQNAGRRLRGLAPLPVPVKPEPPMGWELSENGDYAGFTTNDAAKENFLAGGDNRTARKVESLR